MLEDMDYEMEKRRLNAVLILGDTTFGNPELYYVVGSHLPRGGIYIKKLREEPILVTSNIDIGSAKKGRVRNIQTYTEYGYEKLLQKFERNKALILFYDNIFRAQKIEGRIAIFGKMEICSAVNLVDNLRRMGHRITGEKHPTLLEALRETKDALEIQKIREVGRKTESVVERTLNFLRECKIENGKLLHEGDKLTVGKVKSYVRRFLAEENLTATQDMIFAVGRKSADPHYMGEESDLVLANQPIIFDVFPQEVGGYYFDTTRTFVIGNPSEKIREMHRLVLETQLLALDMLKEGAQAKEIMNSVYDNVERHGYKTYRDAVKGDVAAQTTGFIHSLGHGVGLTIGEKPFLSLYSEEKLKTGHVITVEPGLYEPGVGGVRVEDVVVVKGDTVENLSHLDKSLEL
jgi:Xaa-Pro aminopeptidase